MRRAEALSVVMALVAGLSLGGCGKRPESSNGAAADSAATHESATAAADRRPANLSPAIGQDDSLINSTAPQLKPWVDLWAQAIPGFATDSLHRGAGSPAFRGNPMQPLPAAESLLAGKSHRVFFVDSPDRQYTLVIDQYQGVVEDKGVLVASVGIDSAPLLLDRERKTATRFAFCGTGCRFEWGAWLDAQRFALAGSGSWKVGGIDVPCGYLDIYSLADSTRVRYWTRVITDAERRSYGAAWGQWLRNRYHELEDSRARR